MYNAHRLLIIAASYFTHVLIFAYFHYPVSRSNQHGIEWVHVQIWGPSFRWPQSFPLESGESTQNGQTLQVLGITSYSPPKKNPWQWKKTNHSKMYLLLRDGHQPRKTSLNAMLIFGGGGGVIKICRRFSWLHWLQAAAQRLERILASAPREVLQRAKQRCLDGWDVAGVVWLVDVEKHMRDPWGLVDVYGKLGGKYTSPIHPTGKDWRNS